MTTTLRASAMLATLLLASCGGDDGDGGGALASGATCPPGSTLAYADFDDEFFGVYCTRCHASALSGPTRSGAPVGADFDTLDGIRPRRFSIDARAGSGPLGTFTVMPPGPPVPSPAERAVLSQWIACGAP